MTSGGDAPGMNAALKGAVRAALNEGWEVYGIKDAYKGLVKGGDYISPLDWVDVNWSFREGGTFLGSARFTDLKGNTPEAIGLRQQALLNLKNLGINGLIVIGGDGSLNGALTLFDTLETLQLDTDKYDDTDLSIVGIPGSIDNDIPYTDMSIGVDTTLNTIVECIDKLRDTAASHKRVIIVEVMGRRRGYLAVLSGLATGADRVFIREEAINQKELNNMLNILKDSFSNGQRAGIIVRAEGAVFSTNFLKETIDVLLEPKREVRETVLGHLQRGGVPTVFERTLAIRYGIMAVELLKRKLYQPQMVGLNQNRLETIPLKKIIKKALSSDFQENLSPNTLNAFSLGKKLEITPDKKDRGISIAILTDGNNVSGMNMAIRAVARLAINKGIDVKGIKGGFDGLLEGPANFLSLDWSMLEMKSILRRAGTLLGVSVDAFTNKKENFIAIKKNLENFNIKGLIVIGNKKTYDYAYRLVEAINIPIVGVPADLNCNLPGTDWVVGMDSALNDLLRGIDRSADAAHVKGKVTIIHIKGEYCNCGVKFSALAGGTEGIIIDDRTYNDNNRDAFEKSVKNKTDQIKKIIDMGKSFATIIFFSRHGENEVNSLELIKESIVNAGIKQETNVISLETSYGGIIPTAFDRVLGKRLGEHALVSLLNKIDKKDHKMSIVGINGKRMEDNTYEKFISSDCQCPTDIDSELENCINLMSIPSENCIGLGGDVTWTDINDKGNWGGKWICKKCGYEQKFQTAAGNTHCIHCKNNTCNNYGYIRVSRRL